MPTSVTDMVGSIQTFSGGLFSSKVAIDPTPMKVLDCRWSDSYIISKKTGVQTKHPAFELLVKRKGVTRSRWTRPFPIREYIEKDGKWVDNPEYQEQAVEKAA